MESFLSIRTDPQIRKICQTEEASKGIYNSDRWLVVLQKGFNCKVKKIEVVLDGECVARFPFAFRSKGSFLIGGAPLRGTHTEFGGWFAKGADQKMIMNFLHRKLREMGFSWIEFAFLGEPNNLEQVMSEIGYKVEPRHSLVVELRGSEDTVWNAFSGRARTEIRKATKSGLKVVRLDLEHVRQYMNLVQAVFSRQRRLPSFDINFLEEVHKNLSSDDFAHYGVFLNGSLIAGGLFLYSQNRMVFVSGASDLNSRRLGVNSLVQWHAIKCAIERGVSVYDMGGIGVHSIDKFKESFGGRHIEYNRYVYCSWFAFLPAWIFKRFHAYGWAK